MTSWKVALAGAIALFLGGCGGGGGGGGEPPPTTTYSVGGTISGLSGSVQLGLSINGAAPVTRTESANGSFSFSTQLNSGQTYTVTVVTQPSGQTCTVSNGSGTVGAANITNIAVVCTSTFSVGGTISGLSGSVVLGLSINNAAPLTRTESANGTFSFVTRLTSGQTYSVSVITQPSGQTCTVSNGSGTIAGADITNISVVCTSTSAVTVGGTVSGLNGPLHLQISINGVPSATLRRVDQNGSFAFTQTLTTGDTYAVSVATHPSGQFCTVTNGSGTIGSSSVITVSVACVTTGPIPTYYSVGGTVSGLAGTAVLRLTVNGFAFGDDITVSTNFTFPHRLSTGQTYAVSVQTQPPGLTCSVSNASGTIASANVTNVSLTCVPQPFTVGGTVSGLTGSVTLRMVSGSTTSDRFVNANGSFSFTQTLTIGQPFTVSVLTQPTGQTCTVSNGTGVMGSANVTNISVSCTTNTFTVGGAISGLNGGTVVLRLGSVSIGNVDQSFTLDGSFVFTPTLPSGESYSVTVVSNPTNRTCTVTNGSGTIGSANVTNVSVTCQVVSTTCIWGTSLWDACTWGN